MQNKGNGKLLEVDRLTKAYRLGHERISVLQGLSLTLARGELMAIMGPSGAGKTTLLNCLSGIDTADGGDIRLHDRPLAASTEEERTLLRRHEIGMVFQFFNLVPTLTARENVALPFLIMGRRGAAEEREVDALLELMGMSGRADHYPFQLSGGEMQLVSIARALVHGPSLLLADEPTGNVNPSVGRSIMGTLLRAAEQRETAVLMVTHSPVHAAWADRVCFLKGGVIAGELAHGRRRDDVSPIYEKLLELDI